MESAPYVRAYVQALLNRYLSATPSILSLSRSKPAIALQLLKDLNMSPYYVVSVTPSYSFELPLVSFTGSINLALEKVLYDQAPRPLCNPSRHLRAYRIASLPLSKGGLGFTPLHAVASATFITIHSCPLFASVAYVLNNPVEEAYSTLKSYLSPEFLNPRPPIPPNILPDDVTDIIDGTFPKSLLANHPRLRLFSTYLNIIHLNTHAFLSNLVTQDSSSVSCTNSDAAHAYLLLNRSLVSRIYFRDVVTLPDNKISPDLFRRCSLSPQPSSLSLPRQQRATPLLRRLPRQMFAHSPFRLVRPHNRLCRSARHHRESRRSLSLQLQLQISRSQLLRSSRHQVCPQGWSTSGWR